MLLFSLTPLHMGQDVGRPNDESMRHSNRVHRTSFWPKDQKEEPKDPGSTEVMERVQFRKQPHTVLQTPRTTCHYPLPMIWIWSYLAYRQNISMPSQGRVTHSPTLTPTGKVQTCQVTSCAHLRDVGGNRRTWGKPKQTWRERANPDSGPQQGSRFFHQHCKKMTFKDLLYIQVKLLDIAHVVW